ncbi:hypothetical protein ACJBSM_12520, partial [Streptococcus suis]
SLSHYWRGGQGGRKYFYRQCAIIVGRKKRPTSAYIHMPFCTQICYYFDYYKVYIKNQPVDEY